MQCRQFKSRIGWFLETPGAGRRHEAMRRHAHECAACAAELRAEQRLRRCFEALPDPAMLPGFQERILSRAIAQGDVRRARRRSKWIRIAVPALATAGAAVFLAVWLWPVSPQPADSASEVALSLHKTRQVGFVFHVHRRIRNARIVVSLPQGVEVNGHPARRLSWHVDLNRGDNLLRLPLVARAPGDGVVSAEVVVVGSAAPLARAQLITHVTGATRTVTAAGTSGA